MIIPCAWGLSAALRVAAVPVAPLTSVADARGVGRPGRVLAVVVGDDDDALLASAAPSFDLVEGPART